MNGNLARFVFVSGVIVAAAAFAIMSWPRGPASAKLDAFAKCLAEKNATMYGADWCPHCQAQKAAFGGSFKFVPYVECPQNPKLCLDKGIEGYPTWIFADGARLEGDQPLDRISAQSGCSLPADL